MLGGGNSFSIICNTESFYAEQEIKPDFKTQYWSMEKMAWLQTEKFPKLPSNFSMISGCTVAVNRNIVLLIGGQKIWQQTLQANVNYYLVQKHVPNNQVVHYNSQNQKWTWLENIPYEQVSYKCTEKCVNGIICTF